MDKKQPKLPAEEPEDELDQEPSPPPAGPPISVEDYKKLMTEE